MKASVTFRIPGSFGVDRKMTVEFDGRPDWVDRALRAVRAEIHRDGDVVEE